MRFLALIVAVFLLTGCATTAPVEPLAEETRSQQSQLAQEDTQISEPTDEEVAVEVSETIEPATESEPTVEPEIKQESPEPEETQTTEPESTETEALELEESPESAPEPTIVGYTLQEVSERNSQADCWVAIDGGVYDLTLWIRSHPGGSAAILQLCGTDGTQMFLGQHGGQARPASALDGYYIGPLR